MITRGILTRTGGVWNPWRKPLGGVGRNRLDRTNELSRSLLSAVVFDGPPGVGSAQDYCGRTLTEAGTPVYPMGQYGASFAGVNNGDGLNYASRLGGSVANWSFSALCLFDGTSGPTGGSLLSGGPSGVMVSTFNANTAFAIGDATLGGGGVSLTQTSAGLTGWHRITVTVAGTAMRFFVDGRLNQAATAGATPTGTGPASLAGDSATGAAYGNQWIWPVADAFYWNRTLNDQEVAYQYAMPYDMIVARPTARLISPGAQTPVFLPRELIVGQEQPRHPLPVLSPGPTVLVVPPDPPIVDWIITRTGEPQGLVSVLRAGPQGPNVLTKVTDSILGRQEQPAHPLSQMRASIQGPNVLTKVVDSVILRPQQPDHPLPFLRPSIQGPNVLTKVTDSILGRQEQPGHPLPVLGAGVQGPSVRVPVSDRISTAQEQPSHLQPRLLPGVQGPNVRVPVSDVLFVRQEQPGHPAPRLQAGPQGPDVRAPVTDALVTRQEQPGHPLPRLAAGVQGPNVRPPVADVLLVRQEQPGHPLPQLRAGRQGPDVRAPVSDVLLVRQEQPAHPPPRLAAGVQGPDVGWPLPGILGRQEQPAHPLPVLSSYPPTSQVVGARSPVTDTAIVRQEQPAHPLPQLRAGVQGPDVAAPPQVGEVVVGREQPWHPQPTMQAGVQGPNVRAPVSDSIIVRQQQPDHPLPVLRASTQTPIVQTAAATTLIVRQEVPAHPLPVLRGTPQSIPFVARPLFVGQEQPQHPLPVLASGPTSLPAVAILATLMVRQQQPEQPLPQLRAGVVGPSVRSPTADTILVRQEQPRHPLPVLEQGTHNVPVLFTLFPSIVVLVRQEQPYHPLPWLDWRRPDDIIPPPPPPPPPFIVGRTVFIVADPESLPSFPTTRTVFLVPDPVMTQPFPTARTVFLQPDTGAHMQFLSPLSFGQTGPMDNDPFTFDATKWLALIPGDVLLPSSSVTIYSIDETTNLPVPQTSVTISAFAVRADGLVSTVWLTGGVPGVTYLVTFQAITQAGRRDKKSATLTVVGYRS